MEALGDRALFLRLPCADAAQWVPLLGLGSQFDRNGKIKTPGPTCLSSKEIGTLNFIF